MPTCVFDRSNFKFQGTPAAQARCLLRKVLPLGNVSNTSATLPSLLETLVGNPCDVSREKLVAYLAANGIATSEIGGALSDPLSTTNGSAGPATTARYFVIHDTSTIHRNGNFSAASATFPASVNTAAWSGNALSHAVGMTTHIMINRLGKSATSNSYRARVRATKRERREIPGDPDGITGLFLHHELVQPRLNNLNGIDEFSPDPGFPEAQLDRLAVCYVAASVRGGTWMIPAFHGVLDLGIPDGHDDPQHFELAAWGAAIKRVRAAIFGVVPDEHHSGLDLRSPDLRGDARLEAVLDGTDMLETRAGVQAGVEKIQRALNKLSATRPQYGIDLGPTGGGAGIFGPKTQRAVLAVQADFGLAQNGKVDKGTIKVIDDALVDGFAPLGVASGYKLPTYARAEFGPAAGVPWATAEPIPALNWYQGLVEDSAHHFSANGVTAVGYEAMFTIDADGSSGDAPDDPDGQTDTSMHIPAGVALNSRQYPFIVLPLDHDDPPGQLMSAQGLSLGDLAVIIYKNGKVLPAIYGDRGPDFQAGEGSMLLAKGMGMSSSPTSGGINEDEVPPGVVHLAFPGTSDVVGTVTSRTAADVQRDALALFDKLRGKTV